MTAATANSDTDTQWLRLADAGDYVPGGAKPKTIASWITRGVNGVRLKAVRVGGFYRVRPKDIAEFLERLTAATV